MNETDHSMTPIADSAVHSDKYGKAAMHR